MKTSDRIKNFYFGLFAEYLTMLIYKLKFYKILSHRFKTFCGEIDLIVIRGKQIVFVEVKARSKVMDFEILSIGQQKRIIDAAQMFLAKNLKYRDHLVRFDLAFVQSRSLPKIIENAWLS